MMNLNNAYIVGVLVIIWLVVERMRRTCFKMREIPHDYHFKMAITLTNFVDYFITRGATKEDIQYMFKDIVEKIYEDKENLK
jgi:hypothetical protein